MRPLRLARAQWLLAFVVGVAGAATPPGNPAPTAGPTPAPPAARVSPAAPVATAPDRLDLKTTVVTGSRELPKVLYIVPWKKAELGDLPEQPFNTLLDEALAPVDRDEFRREVAYFSALSAGQSSAPAGAASGKDAAGPAAPPRE